VGWGMIFRRGSRRTTIITAYVVAVVILYFGRQHATTLRAPASERVANALIFISDTDSIDAGRGSNSVYRIDVDTPRSIKRIVGSIPHGEGYLRISDIDCESASQQLVLASHRRDLNGFHHARLDGSGLHLDQPATGSLLAATRQIAIAADGRGIVVSRQFEDFAEPRFGLVAGDLFSRNFKMYRAPSADRSYISPVFSPSGRLLAYIAKRHDDDAEWASQLVVAVSGGRQERVIFQTDRQISEVAWSPTGEWLALVVDRQIYRIHGYGGEAPTRLTDHIGGASSPRWSPDGAQISYVAPSSFRGQNQLFVMKADGTGKRRVANIRGKLVNGCWV